MADIPHGGGPLGDLFFRTPLGQVTVAVRNALCQLWNDFPGFTEELVGRVPRANILSPFLPMICDQPQPSNAPASPFSGGQCCTVYNFDVVTNHPDAGTSVLSYSASGQLGSISEEVISEDEISTFGNWYMSVGAGCPGAVPTRLYLGGWQTAQPRPTIAIVNVRRADGQPDECGDPPPEFDRTVPPPDRLNFNVDVNVGGTNISVPVSFTIGSPTIGINFRPEINIQVGGINMIFDFQGITFNFNGNEIEPFSAPDDPRDPDDQPPRNYPPVAPPYILPPGDGPGSQPGTGGGGGGNVDCPDVNLQPVLNAIDVVKEISENILEVAEELLDCDRCKRLVPEECNRVLMGSGQSIIKPLNSAVQWIEIELTTIPENAKTQWGVDAPDVYYAGWYSIGSNGCGGDRHPVAYQRNIYPMIDGARTFSYTLQSGYSANIWMYFYQDNS